GSIRLRRINSGPLWLNSDNVKKHTLDRRLREHAAHQKMKQFMPPIHTLAVIPARLASTRLPRKVLREIAGKPMLQWIVEAAFDAPRLDRVVIATDSPEVMTLAAEHGWEAMMTSPDLQSGSDRVHAVSQQIPSEIVVNIQGDEPMLQPAHIDALLAPFDRAGIDAQVTTLWTACTPEEIADPNAVKVVLAEDGRALYFSRSTIPFHRDAADSVTYRKHLGLYAYRRAALERFAHLPPHPLEATERLEQLRLLAHNIPIYVEQTPYTTIGVDTEADLERVAKLLAKRQR
ncbi:MAG TPA: 3-deoxy-manno-octulosonate cytidylyltransferase, partial [Acidobacteriaceae bacterium]